MANPTWNGSNDDWTTAADWSTGTVPGTADDATIGQGEPEITSDVGTVDSVMITGSGAVQVVDGRLATTASFTNQGRFYLDIVPGQGGSSLDVGGPLTNAANAFFQAGNSALAAPTTIHAAALDNAGTLQLAGGATNTLSIDVAGPAGFGTMGTLTGQVGIGSGARIAFGSGAITTIAAGAGLSLDGTGSIAITGGGADSALTTLATINGTLFLSDGALLTTSTKVTVAQAGSVTLEGGGSAETATFAGLANAGKIQLSAGDVDEALDVTGDAGNTGTVTLESGGAAGVAHLGVGGDLTNSNMFNVDASSSTDGGSTVSVTGTLTNTFNGRIMIGDGSTTSADSIVTVGGLSNAGSLGLVGGTTSRSVLDVQAAAGFGTMGAVTGQVALSGDAVIQFANGAITQVASGGTLDLTGAAATIDIAGQGADSALTTLATLDGSLDVEGNIALATTTGMTIDAGGSLTAGQFLGGGTLNIGGALTIDAGGIALIGGFSGTAFTVDAKSLAVQMADATEPAGFLEVQGGSDPSSPDLLDIAAPAGFGTTGALSGAVELLGAATLQFQSGTIGTITQGSSLELSGPAASIQDVGGAANSALDLADVAGSLTLQDGADLTTGALTLTGSLGVAANNAATTLTVGALNASPGASLDASGDTFDGFTGTIAIGNAAPKILDYSIEARDGGVIQFAGGQIAEIGATGSLILQGTGSVSNGATSAAAGLKMIDSSGSDPGVGGLELDSGATLTTAGDLTNDGNINLDAFFGGSGSALTVMGTLTNAESIQVGDPNGFALLQTNDTISASRLVNSGTIALQGGSQSASPILAIAGEASSNAGSMIDVDPYGQLNVSGALTITGADLLNVGAVSAASVSFAADATTPAMLEEGIAGAAAGAFGVMTVTGPVTLGGGVLQIDLGFDFASTPGQTYEIIDNAGTAAIAGTFGNAAQGATITDSSGTEHFTISYTGGTGNDVVLTDAGPVCFAAGTLIRTVRGEEVVDVAVEALRIGDLALTAAGVARPIRWLGHRAIDCRAHPRPRDVWPIRVAANAFGDGLPSTDLFLSAGHAVKIGAMGDVLIPIGKLINGATIARHPVDAVTYWHVELDSHDVLLANDLPAESFLDCGNRFGLIEQAGAYDRRKGPHTPADFCLPFVDAGEVLDAVRTLLAWRAKTLGWRPTHDMDLHLMVDGVRIEPDADGDVARFFFPAAARSVVLASLTRTPGDAAPVDDHRRLGISLRRLEIGDGLCPAHDLAACDERLAGLLHRETEAGCHRFTTGHMALAPALWAGCRSQVVLRVHHDPQGAARWVAPASVASNVVACANSAEVGPRSAHSSIQVGAWSLAPSTPRVARSIRRSAAAPPGYRPRLILQTACWLR